MAVNLRKKLTSRRLIQASRPSTKCRMFSKLFVSENRELSVISSTGRVLQVLSGDTVVVSVHCPHGVQDASIVGESSSRLYLLVLSPDGAVFRTSLSPILNSPDCGATGKTSEDSDSIFDDLLRGDSLIKDPTQTSMTLKDEDIAFHQPRGTRLSCFADYVVILEPNSEFIKVHIYRWTMTGDSGELIFAQTALYNVDHVPVCGGVGEEAVVRFVYPAEVAVVVRSPGEHCPLSAPLYAQLVTARRALLLNPVLLLGSTSGHITAVPLNASSAQFPVSPELVCDVQQTVTAIHHMVGKNSADKLCLVGKHGKLLVLQTSTQASGQWSVTEFFVNGPVLCSLLLGSDLVHYTGSQFVVTDLRQTDSQSAHSRLSSETYDAGRVVSLSGHAESVTPATRWLSISRQGHVYAHVLSEVDSDTEDCVTTPRHGESLKDLLHGISRSADQLLTTQEQVTSMDTVLSQLSLATHLAQATDISSTPLKVTVKSELQHLGVETSMSLRARLENQSSVGLADGWTLTVILSAGANTDRSWSGNLSRSTRLAGLRRGEFQDLVVPLSESQLDSLPLTMEVFVSYRPQMSHRADLAVSLPAGVFVIDILHCLESSRLVRCPSHMSRCERHLSELAKTRPSWKIQDTVTKAGRAKLPTGQLNMKTLVKENQSDLGRTKDSATSQEARLLRHILIDSPVNVPGDQSHVTARSAATGHQVSLWAVRGAGDTTELGWGSDDVRTVGQLHGAITERLQKLSGYSEVKPCHELMEQHAELGRQARSLQDRACFGVEEETVVLFTKLRHMVS